MEAEVRGWAPPDARLHASLTETVSLLLQYIFLSKLIELFVLLKSLKSPICTLNIFLFPSPFFALTEETPIRCGVSVIYPKLALIEQ